jgi:Right handed beta helix region
MNKRAMRCICLVAALLAVSSATVTSVRVAQAAAPKTYYVDSVAGRNAAKGTSPALAWKTIARVNNAALLPGDQVLFKRGGLWREQLTVNDSGTVGNPIVFSTYGTGPAPIITAAKCASAACTHGANKWRLAGATNPIYRSPVKWKAGVFISDGAPLRFVAWTSTTPANMWARMTPGSYTFDYKNKIGYIWSADGASPDLHVIEVGWKDTNIYTAGAHDIQVEGLALRAGTLACVLTYGAVSWVFDNVDVRHCGGRFKDEDPTHTFYLGNGFEISNGSSDIDIRNSTIADVFDSGISPQLYTPYGSVQNITIEATEIFNTPLAGVEIVVISDQSTMSGIIVKNSYIHDAGRGWSNPENPNKIGTGIYATVYPGLASTLAGIVVQDSIIADNVVDGITIAYNTATTQIARNWIANNDYGIIFYDPQNPTSTGGVVIANENSGNRETGLCFYVPHSTTGLQTSGNSSPPDCPATLAQHALLYQ